MGQLINCADEFTVRQQYNRINRVLQETGHGGRVILVVEENPDTETGIGFALLDKATKQCLSIRAETVNASKTR